MTRVLSVGSPTSGSVAAAPGRRRTSARAPLGRTARGPKTPSGLPWILPALAVSVGIIYYCIGYTGYVSTLDWNGTDPSPANVGGANYAALAQDPIFWGAIWHTALSFVVTFVVSSVLGLVFAIIFHSRLRVSVVYKVIVFLPVVLAPAVMAPVFRELFASDGELNWVLAHIGLGSLTQPWLADPGTALFSVITIGIWSSTGLAFILYYAGVSQIDDDIIEAARLDGAGAFRVVLSIVLPSVRGTTIVLATMSVIGALKTFDVPQLVTAAGPNFATEFLGTYIYRTSITLTKVGAGSAASVVLLVIAIGFGIFFSLRGFGRSSREG
jgi:ABC-type sugar transport system permease subunit